MTRTGSCAVLFVILAIASVPSARALCGPANDRHFDSYCYYAPALSPTIDFLGRYWELGRFAETNSGARPAAEWVIFCNSPAECPFGAVGGFSLIGWWGESSLVVGCPSDYPARPMMAFHVSGQTPAGQTVWGGGCTQAAANDGYFHHCATEPEIVPMQLVPRPAINAASRGADFVQLVVASPNLIGGIHDENGVCGFVVQGYRVYSQSIPRNTQGPTDRLRTSDWTALGGVNPLGVPATVVVNCADDRDVYLAYGVVFNDGEELQHVGPNSTLIQCGPTVADPPHDYRLRRRLLRAPADIQ